MSRKPRVVRSAQRAPVRSSKVLIAIVVPWRKSRVERKSAAVFATPFSMPWTSVAVVSVFPRLSSPVVSLKAAMSVNVPPTSADSRISAAGMRGNAWAVVHTCGGLGAQSRHHVADEQADGLQAFPQTEVAEGKLAHNVIALGLTELRGEKFRNRGRGARNALAALGDQIECRGTRMRLRPPVASEQVGKL